MKLSELILAIGDDNIIAQNLDKAAITLSWGIKQGTKITFGTDIPLTPEGTKKLGLVIWLDREAVKAALAKDPHND